MKNDYLLGLEIGVLWDDEETITKYTFKKENASIDKNEVNIFSQFAQAIANKNVGEKVKINDGAEFKIMYIRNASDIKQFLDQREIKNLYHFTCVENLKSILSLGILSKSKLEDRNMRFISNDTQRLEQRYDYISCSISYPNIKLLNAYKNRLNARYAIIEIDANVILDKVAMCSPCNAATYNGYNVKDIGGINELFTGYRENLPLQYPTDEQSEILVKDKIDLKYVKRILFENSDDLKYFASSVPMLVCQEMFKYRSQYLLKFGH